MSSWTRPFREAFCDRYRCTPERFAKVALRKALPLRIRLIRPLVTLLHPEHFRPDFELMERVGGARNWSDVNAALGAFSSNNRIQGGFYRTVLKVRASGRRVSRMVSAVVGDRSSVTSGTPGDAR